MDARFVKITTSLGWFAEFSFALERNKCFGHSYVEHLYVLCMFT